MALSAGSDIRALRERLSLAHDQLSEFLDFPSKRAAFSEKKEFVNNVPFIIPIGIGLCPARQRY